MTISFSFHSPFDVGGSMFDVHLLIRSMFKLLHLKLRLNLHIALILFIQVRSSEITVLPGKLYPFNRFPVQSIFFSGLILRQIGQRNRRFESLCGRVSG